MVRDMCARASKKACQRAWPGSWVASLLISNQLVSAYTLDLNSEASIKSVASGMADDMMSFYNGDQPGQVPGLLPQPYYWWEGGALMGALVDYWYYTGDTKWNDITQQGLLFQVGSDNAYMPPNQTMTEGNDDQGFWGMAVLSAAEYNFPNPPPGQPQWLALAQAVFNTQAARWDTANCNGGLRWQIFQWNNGYNYKNSISQACFFNIAARLALYTRNETYADWANRVWDWMDESKLIVQDSYFVYDGAYIEDDCKTITPYQWTYNAGAFLLGAAAMYNYTADSDPATNQMWRERTDGLLNGTQVFFAGEKRDIMTEVACESVHLCDLDQQSFKAYLSRWMAATTKWAPWTYDRVKPLLETSAMAATQQCTGGNNGKMCGLMWANNNGQWDGTTGAGQQMAAMEVVLGNMIMNLDAPVTNSTGGTSVGDPEAGTAAGDVGRLPLAAMKRPVTKADMAGSWILTIIAMALLISGVRFILHDDDNARTRGERWRELRDDLGPGGILRSRRRQDRETNFAQQETVLGIWNRAMDHGGSSDPASNRMRRKASMAPSVSVYSDQGARLSVNISSRSEYPNGQPWRRPPRQGDYAGAIDPSRGDGAGFGFVDVPKAQPVAAPPPPSSSSRARASVTAGLKELWAAGVGEARELTRTRLTLQKKPLPGKPGLGRLPGRGMGDRKV